MVCEFSHISFVNVKIQSVRQHPFQCRAKKCSYASQRTHYVNISTTSPLFDVVSAGHENQQTISRTLSDGLGRCVLESVEKKTLRMLNNEELVETLLDPPRTLPRTPPKLTHFVNNFIIKTTIFVPDRFRILFGHAAMQCCTSQR